MPVPAATNFIAKAFERERLTRVADCLAMALAASLPWSTSATGILAALLLAALIPTLDLGMLRRELSTAAGGLPVLLWTFGLIGVLWANVPLTERLAGLDSFHKLLMIPLLMAQFHRSGRGLPVLRAFLISCAVLLLASWILAFLPGLSWRGKGGTGVPVKDYISQGVMFSVCTFVLADCGLQLWRKGRQRAALGLYSLSFLFLANILFVLTSRTALAVVPVLLIVFVATRLTVKNQLAVVVSACVLAGAAWVGAPSMRENMMTLVEDVQHFDPLGSQTRASLRLEFWSKSVDFVKSAPLIGNGTGSIPELFRRSAAGQSGVASAASSNPHNQTLAVAIQLGLLGVGLLWAMWAAHLWMFRGPGLAGWTGLVIVIQNVTGSLFNSHLFDFTHGWLYVVGVGIAGGMVRRSLDTEGRGSH